MISREKKAQFWNHFTDQAQRSFRPKKITDLRLKQIKNTVLDEDFFWQAVIAQHDALDKTPDELRESSPPDYERARSSFWTMIRGKIRASVGKSNRAVRKPD